MFFFDGSPEAWGGIYHAIRTRLATLPEAVDFPCGPLATCERLGEIAIIVRTSGVVDRQILDRMPRLRLIQQAGAGVENIDIADARARGVAVANVPTRESGAARAVAEHGVALIIGLLRRYREHADALQNRHLGRPIGASLRGKTVGLIGYGAIGRELARLLEPFEAQVVAVNRSGIAPDDGPRIAWVKPAARLADLLATVDVVVLACPLNSATRRMIGRSELQQCKLGVHIVNLARGPLLDPQAALEGLESGRIGGLGLDVFETEPPDPNDSLLLHPRTIASPHIAAATAEVVVEAAAIVARNIIAVAQGQRPNFEIVP